MNPSKYIVITIVAVVSVAAQAQQRREAHIGYVYPAGGRQGGTFQVAIGGQYLDNPSAAIISGDGVTAMIVEHAKPLSGKDFQLLRDKYKALMERKLAATRPEAARIYQQRRKAEKAGDKAPAKKSPKGKAKASGPPKLRSAAPAGAKPVWTDSDERALDELRKKLRNAPNREINPAIRETVFVEIKIAPDAPTGRRELRLNTRLGLTNPMVFEVGKLPEFSEASPPSTSQVDYFRNRARLVEERKQASMEAEVRIPATLNGQIMPGDADRFRFRAREGQSLVIAAQARELIPYLADAVPGWFEATLALYDAKGNELASVDRWRFHQDPVLTCEIPADGEYVMEIRDSIYRGRQDFVYRVTIGELPLVTSVFPLGYKAGDRPVIDLTGWNLPAPRLKVKNDNRSPGVHDIELGAFAGWAERVSLAVDTLPECLEQADNDTPKTAQKLRLPIIVNGRIDKPGDRDVFRFTGRAGQQVVAEVMARRLDSPLDSVLKLTDAAGRQIAYNDDHEDKGCGLETHHADSYILASLPADGTYYVQLRDVQDEGGQAYAYRLRVSEPRPDFELRVVPSSINTRPGATTPITVYALRKDGFDGDIKMSMKGSEGIFSLGGATIPAGTDCIRMTLAAPRKAMDKAINIAMVGKAKIDGDVVIRTAEPADDMMQAFIYRHLVVARDMKVNFTRGYAGRAPVTLASKTPVRIPAGGSVKVKFDRPGAPVVRAKGKAAQALAAGVHLQLNAPPDGITLAGSELTGVGPSITLKADAARIKPGLRGNLIVDVYIERSVPAAKGSKKMVKRRWLAATLPAVPFEVVAGGK